MSFKKAIKRIKEQGFVKQQEDETFKEFLHKNYQNIPEEEFHKKLVKTDLINKDTNPSSV